MRLVFLSFVLFVNFNFFVEEQREIDCYRQALKLIVNSDGYKEYRLGNKNYHISSEIITFSNFDRFFKKELKVYDKAINDNKEVVSLKEEMLSLNVRKFGKIKIYFSEIKNNIFFAEIFIDKKENNNYNGKPIFGSGRIYMFERDKDRTLIVATKNIYYN